MSRSISRLTVPKLTLSKLTLSKLVAALLLIATVAAACGGDDDDQAVGTGGEAADDEAAADDSTALPTVTPAPPRPASTCTFEEGTGGVTEIAENTDVDAKPVIETADAEVPATGLKVDLVEGEGEPVEPGDVIVMQYAGSLLNTGAEFDSSWSRGQPFTFGLGAGEVISGWDLGIVGMKPGGRRQLVLPPECAYGESGSGSGAIGPDETLVFIVDLVAVEPTIDVPDTLTGEVEAIDLVVGDGVELSDGDRAVADYVAQLEPSGEALGSSVTGGGPLEFTVGQDTIAPGLDEAAAGLAVGGTRLIILPPEATAEQFGPGESLLIQLELTAVIPGVDIDDKPEVEVPDEVTGELEVTDLIEGEGDEVMAGDTVYVHYVGVAQSTGAEFDSSWERGEAFSVLVGTGQVIPGWDQGLQGMKPGGRRLLVIPGELAYGEAGQGADIGPDETLVFVVDLLAVT